MRKESRMERSRMILRTRSPAPRMRKESRMERSRKRQQMARPSVLAKLWISKGVMSRCGKTSMRRCLLGEVKSCATASERLQWQRRGA
eukprot:177068-Karenia_brevis.AAC.1